MIKYKRFFEYHKPYIKEDSSLNNIDAFNKYSEDNYIDKKIENILIDIIKGDPCVLYHGTTHHIDTFDIKKSRTELNSSYYGDGIFLTPDINIAWKYAYANRNVGFEVELIEELKNYNRELGVLLEDFYKHGNDVWNFKKYKNEDGTFKDFDVDPNNIADIAEWIPNSKLRSDRNKHYQNVTSFDLFGSDSGFNLSWFADELKKLGIKKYIPYPRVYSVIYKTDPDKVIVSDKEVKSSRYDTVVFIGDDLVEGTPEIQSFKHNLKPSFVKMDEDI